MLNASVLHTPPKFWKFIAPSKFSNTLTSGSRYLLPLLDHDLKLMYKNEMKITYITLPDSRDTYKNLTIVNG